MSNRRNTKNRKQSRLARIERKCDVILSELAIIRKSVNTRHRSVDDAIERMHNASRRMRTEAERDARILRRVFQFK
jgi:hypothetical protein